MKRDPLSMIPVRPSPPSPRRPHTIRGSKATAAVIDARESAQAFKIRKANALAHEGSKIAIAGRIDCTDHAAIREALDRARHHVGDMVLILGGAAKGCDYIAALWAKARNVPQIVFKPDFTAHKKAAPFKRNDAMLATRPRGVIVFPGNGIVMNLAQKAEGSGIKVWYRGGAKREEGCA